MNVLTTFRRRMVFIAMLVLSSFHAFSQTTCNVENITNGSFTNGSTAGWTLGTGWVYGNDFIGVANVTQPATNFILSQVISKPLTTQTYQFAFRMGTHDLNSGDRSRTASLEIKIGGITYARFNNGTGDVNNVTLELFNGATSDFQPYGTTTGWVGATMVNFNIPFDVAQATNNEIAFVYNSTGDYFIVHRVSLLGCETSLPVRLTRFTVKKAETDVLLNWETATESANSHFDIETSTDAVNFTYLATVAGHGTTDGPQKYSYVHKDPLPGITYYRLKQVDDDGTYEYFTIRSIDITAEEFIYPNPASNHLILSNMTPGTTYAILDEQGRLVIDPQVASQASVVLDISALARGTHFVRFTKDGKVVTRRLYFK